MNETCEKQKTKDIFNKDSSDFREGSAPNRRVHEGRHRRHNRRNPYYMHPAHRQRMGRMHPGHRMDRYDPRMMGRHKDFDEHGEHHIYDPRMMEMDPHMFDPSDMDMQNDYDPHMDLDDGQFDPEMDPRYMDQMGMRYPGHIMGMDPYGHGQNMGMNTFGNEVKFDQNMMPMDTRGRRKTANDIDPKIYQIDTVAIFGMIIVGLILCKFYKRNFLTQRLLSVSWFIFGYKVFLEKAIDTSDYWNNKMNILFGLINFGIGSMLFINFRELYKIKQKWSWRVKDIFKNIKFVINFFVLNLTFSIYDLNKVFEQEASIIFYIIYLGLNLVPIVMNSYIDMYVYKLPWWNFPSPLAITTLTLFLNYYRGYYPVDSIYYTIIDCTCFGFIFLKYSEDLYYGRFFTWENAFYLLMTLINLFVIYLDLLDLYPPKPLEELFPELFKKVESQQVTSLANFRIEYRPNADAGIKGYENTQFFIDQFGIIANAFMKFCTETLTLITEENLREVKIQPELIKYVYPKLV